MNEPLPRGSETSLVLTHLMQPADANYMGNIHGGTIMKLIDEAAAACAFRFCRTSVVTAAIDRIDFHHPVRIGDLVRFLANVNYTGTRSVEVGVRVEAEDLTTGVLTHTNSAYLVFVALGDTASPSRCRAWCRRPTSTRNGSRRRRSGSASGSRSANPRTDESREGRPGAAPPPERAGRPQAQAAGASPSRRISSRNAVSATSSCSSLGSLVVKRRCISIPGLPSVRASG